MLSKDRQPPITNTRVKEKMLESAVTYFHCLREIMIDWKLICPVVRILIQHKVKLSNDNSSDLWKLAKIILEVLQGNFITHAFKYERIDIVAQSYLDFSNKI